MFGASSGNMLDLVLCNDGTVDGVKVVRSPTDIDHGLIEYTVRDGESTMCDYLAKSCSL